MKSCDFQGFLQNCMKRGKEDGSGWSKINYELVIVKAG